MREQESAAAATSKIAALRGSSGAGANSSTIRELETDVLSCLLRITEQPAQESHESFAMVVSRMFKGRTLSTDQSVEMTDIIRSEVQADYCGIHHIRDEEVWEIGRVRDGTRVVLFITLKMDDRRQVIDTRIFMSLP